VNDLPQRICRGCGAGLDRTLWALDRDLRASPECWHSYGQLTVFAGRHPELAALRQLTADTYGAQHAGAPTPPIDVARALVGLHLALERGLDDVAVGAAQQRMAGPAPWWPPFPPPEAAAVTVVEVLREGADVGSVAGHSTAVGHWAEAVWRSWAEQHEQVRALTDRLFAGEHLASPEPG